MTDLEQSIDEICTHFEREIEDISRLVLQPGGGSREPSSGSGPLYRKLLYVTLIDALSGLRFNHKQHPEMSNRNRERFSLFVREHCSWPAADLVSIPFLAHKLSSSDQGSSDLREYVFQIEGRFATDDGGMLDAGEVDVRESVLGELASSDAESKAIARCSHLALLYRYRSCLVHESRQPGQGMDIRRRQQPYYHRYLGSQQWHLVYPLGMFESLAKEGVASFRTYLRKQAIDPYDAVDGGPAW